MAQAFANKAVIITGSSSGIGQAAAILFAKSGAFVTIHGRSEDGIKKTADLILDAGIPKERIHSVRGSVTEEKTLKALIDETISKFGKIDVLINNVGIANKEGIQNSRSMENLDYVLDVNLKSVIALTELAIPHLEKTKGNIVNVSSIGSQKTSTSVPYYCIAKAGLDHFARNYAAILAPKGVRINNLNPGATETAIFSRAGIPDEMIAKMKQHYTDLIPFHRWGTSEEMGEFLIFMASDKASYMTGQTISVDGGILIHSPSIKFD
jgi:NAD(P)-dependent dehydrogenase (short-subunit alcohol dehydrogenase family)